MPLGRNPRFDPRRSSPYCSTTTIVVFLALGLMGVWMMTSSSIVPIGMSSSDTNTEVKQEVTETVGKHSEESNGNSPVDTTNGDTIDDSNSAASDESSQYKTGPDVTTENAGETTQGENSVKGKEDTKVESADASDTQAYTDANGKLESGEVVKEGREIVKDGDSKSGGNTVVGEEDRQDRSMEKDTVENENDEQGKNTNQNLYQTENNEGEKSAEENEQDNTSGKNSDQPQSNSKDDSTIENSDKIPTDEQQQSDKQKNSDQDNNSDADALLVDKDEDQMLEKIGKNRGKGTEEDSTEKKTEAQSKEQGANEMLPSGAQPELLKENNEQIVAWSTQASESKNEKEVQASSSSEKQIVSPSWKLCSTTAGADYIPCLDNEESIKKLPTTKHYEHRERHCPDPAPTCLVPLPDGYKKSIEWPASRDKIWYHNVPHTKLAVVKGHQNWVKVSGEYLTFPGGGTQFKYGALHYIDVVQESLPDIAWGKQSRVVLDVGCGVASFGGFLFDRDVLTMSFAPKDEHEAQVQFALERGIPAISAVMGTKRLPYPAMVFDVIHCARCRVPWHIEGGMLLLELNRLLRPGGYFVWSATPVYQKLAEDVEIWKAMKSLMKSICWEMVTKTKDKVDQVGLAIFRKPSNNSCYEKRKQNAPQFCQESDDPNAAWNVQLQACMHKLPADLAARGSKWPEQWPLRLETVPYWLNNSQTGVYDNPAPEDFKVDQEHWNTVVTKSYLNGMGIDWSKVRNVMDMRAVYGGFAAALRDMKLWVMNVVSIDSPDTLPIIFERGLFGMYHDWCESFSTYPRSYDLVHADHLFSRIKKRCKVLPLMAEVDRMLRPEGKLIIRDSAEVISEVESIAKSLNWEIRMTFSKQNEAILCVMKTAWRPKELDAKR